MGNGDWCYSMSPIQSFSLDLLTLVDLISMAYIHPLQNIHMAQVEPYYISQEIQSKSTTNKMLVTCGYPDPQYLKISTVATSQTCINLCSLHHSNTTTLATYHQREKCKKPHQENITMATSGIQQSAFAGQTALKQSNEFVRKFGGSGNSRFVMRRTVKSAPQSIW